MPGESANIVVQAQPNAGQNKVVRFQISYNSFRIHKSSPTSEAHRCGIISGKEVFHAQMP